MAEAPIPQFGTPEPGVVYRDRPAAFGVLEQDGRIALARITKPELGTFFDLPGGALDPGEDERQAMAREFGEEVGLAVEAADLICRADQFIHNPNGTMNNRSAIFTVRLVEARPALKIEDDHELVWLAPQEALLRLRHDSHAWAVLAWMRRRPA